MENGTGEGIILGIISACGGGDWPPVLALAAALRERGHAVRMVCDAGTAGAARAAGLPAICLPAALDLGGYFYPAVRRLLAGGGYLAPAAPNPLTVWARACASFVRSSLQGWRISVVVSAMMCQGLARDLSDALAVPWCFVNPSFYYGDRNTRPGSPDFSVPGAWMVRHWLLPLSRKAALVLHATDPVFDVPPEGLPTHHSYVGPLFWEMPAGIPEAFSRPGPPWVLVTLSSSPQAGDLAIVQAALGAIGRLAAEGQAFRVLATLSAEHDLSALGPIADTVHVGGYVPHSRVLPDCRLVISHAGHGIVMKALYHGTPMVLVPWGRDQAGVASRATALGAAAVVRREDCRPETLARAVRRILEDPGFRERSRVASHRLQATDAPAVAAALVESLRRA